tara:strand:- start:377 stop:3592 length:3216 start_codon:yes stop_codon:yes gene_type:complete
MCAVMADQPFDDVSPQVDLAGLDTQVQSLWDQERIFEKTLEANRDAEPFVFYEGPPTANGMPHPGHVLTRVMKDVFLRYRSMRGRYVPRRAGWDTHGLPVEVEVEKALGISGREAIAEYGVEPFAKECIESVFKYIDHWRTMTRRIGFWVDLDDAYVTFHKSYVESVWWALKRMFDEGLLYQDYKVVWWWAQGGTALSAGEVGQGYKEVDDPSVMVRFPVKGSENTSFLAWTTTPWTLPSNIALAVKADAPYVTLELEDGSRVVVAKALAETVMGDTARTVVDTRPGSEWVGAEYEPPFRYAEPEDGPAFRVIAADFVELGTGSGMVHLAPAFGEDDFAACRAEGLGFLQLVKPDGTFPPEVTDFAGRFCKEADRDIIRNLRSRELLFKEEVYRHEYPFSWRKMDDPLIQYARTSWFIATTKRIDEVKANNQQVNWEPEHIKDGRFGQFLEGNVDWALSRERFWGTPLPIWINDETGAMDCVGSVAEILERNPDAFAHFEAAKAADPTLREDLMVHKPWIDEVTWQKPGEAGTYRRVPEVIDCWFDSGCMPFAQWGYPHQNQDKLAKFYPADFITEAVDQTRGWFYSLIMINTILFGDAQYPHPYKNCFVMGLVTDAKGKKLSKRDKNYTDPLVLMDQVGADAVRWALYANTVPGQNTRFHDKAATDAVRELILKLWNVFSFFVTYANIDGWTPAKSPALADRSDMDRWVLAELDFAVRKVGEELDQYKSHIAVRHLSAFVDSLSNWYVRRSRSRFWAEGDGADKRAAFATLYEVLVDLTKLLAPFVPFVTEEVFQNLVRRHDGEAPESVHLASYPTPDDARVDDELRHAMALARQVVTAGSRVRNEHKLKVRQPLGEAIVVVADEGERAAIENFAAAIREELNVEKLSFTEDATRYVTFELLPNFRALGPKLGKKMPLLKKTLGQMNGGEVYQALTETGKLVVALEGDAVELGPDDVQARLHAREGFAAASEGGHVVVLDTEITDALRRAMLAREVISRVQKARKEADLAFDDRIALSWHCDGELAQAIEEHAETIANETLATGFTRGVEGEAIDADVEGTELKLGLRVV